MKAFLDKEFLLNTEAAKKLYHEAAENQPIIDYHCHLSPREIFEDIRYENITQVWLGGDHYKWRLMRSAGVPEKYITGDASDWEKFEKYAEVLGKAIGNPLYHWSRSFLSYPRHEYFRRILCRIFGEWVEEGFYPEDYDTLKEIAADISYRNAKRYFAFEEKKI